MAQTPTGVSTSYCSAVRMFDFHDPEQVADLLRTGDNPRPTYKRMTDTTSVEGTVLNKVLLAACGELESACLVGNRYTPADLAALTNSGLGKLQKLVADLAFWALMQRRQPASADPKNCPGALQALEELDRLRLGERVFGFTESAEAGLPSVSEPDVSQQYNPLLDQAARAFGTHSDRNQRGGNRPYPR